MNLKVYYITVLFLLGIFSVSAQTTATVVWQHSFGTSTDDEARCMIATSDGGFLLAGYESADSTGHDGNVKTCHGSADYWLVKIDSNANLKWQKTYGGSKSDIARTVIQTTDGGYIIAGQASSTDGDVTGNHGDYDFWIVKIKSNGKLQWQKTYGGSLEENAYGIEQTSDGGYIIAGYTYSNDGDINGTLHGDTGEDVWIVKIDSKGTMQWQKTYGGTDREEAASIHQTTDGGYIVSAWTRSNDGDVTGNNGNFDFWVLKLDNAGAITWQKALGGSGEDGAREARQTVDGGYIVGGYTSSSDSDVTKNHGKRDYWLVKLNSIGNLIWQKTYGGKGDDYDYYVQQLSDGGFLLNGYTTSNNGDVTNNHGGYDYWAIQTDSVGKLLWQKTCGGDSDDAGRNILQTKDGGYVVSGYSKSQDGECTSNHGNFDMWVEKFTFNQSPKTEIDMNTTTEGKSSGELNARGKLEQNFPNPFQQNTTIGFSVPNSFTTAKIVVSDINGNEVTDFAISQPGAGQVQLANKLAPGCYVYALVIDGKIHDMKKLIVTQ